jgi:RNA polymerase sigma-70 factor (ECF subfamily)
MDAARRKVIHDAMVRLSDGDRSAFDVLLDALWPVVLAFAQRGLNGSPDAEDVAQEVFVRICARITDFDRSRDGLSWAFGIASYEVMTHRRRLHRRREVQDEPAFTTAADLGASQVDLILQRETVRAFEQAVGALTEDDRLALGLVGSASAQEIPMSTLRKRKQRALDRLRGLWRTIHGES